MLYAEMGERMTEKTEDELKRELKSISEIFRLDFQDVYTKLAEMGEKMAEETQKEKIAKIIDVVKNEAKNEIREVIGLYYFLLNDRIYPRYKYDNEVAKGIRSANDIYAYIDMWISLTFDEFLLHVNYFELFSDIDIVDAFLRKAGFTIESVHDLPPTPNLKYYVQANIKAEGTEPEYLVVSISDIDTLARIFRVPQIVEQKLGNKKPRKVTTDEFFNDIVYTVEEKQPVLAGYTYRDALDILLNYFKFHEYKYKDEVHKIALAYRNLFPTPPLYKVCYEWKMGMFIKTDCSKLELSKPPS